MSPMHMPSPDGDGFKHWALGTGRGMLPVPYSTASVALHKLYSGAVLGARGKDGMKQDAATSCPRQPCRLRQASWGPPALTARQETTTAKMLHYKTSLQLSLGENPPLHNCFYDSIKHRAKLLGNHLAKINKSKTRHGTRGAVQSMRWRNWWNHREGSRGPEPNLCSTSSGKRTRA